MSENLPDDGALGGVLLSTLNRAAEAAPPPPPDLYRTVTRRYARRRRRLTAAAAAVTVLVLLAGGLQLTRHDRVPIAEPPTLEQRIHDATRTLPTRIDNRQYSVDALLADGRIVVHTNNTEGMVELLALESDGTGWTSTRLVAWQQRPSELVRIADVEANDKWLVWRRSQAGKSDEIWSRRWDEGIPRAIAETGALGTFSIVLDGDLVVYGPSGTGVRTIPAAGGKSTLLPGTAKYYWNYWPWLILDSGSPHQPKSTPTQLWNVKTGERFSTAFLEPDWWHACSPAWCVTLGVDPSAVPRPAADVFVSVIRVDGTDRRSFPGHRSNYARLTPALDRYLPLYRTTRAPDGAEILDLVDVTNGRTTELGRIHDPLAAALGPAVGDDFLVWPSADGKHRNVLDLRALG